MGDLAVPSIYFCPLDPKYFFFDAPRVLDGPPGSPEYARDHYIIGNMKSLLYLKNLVHFMYHPNRGILNKFHDGISSMLNIPPLIRFHDSH